MPEFLTLVSPAQAREKILAKLNPLSRVELLQVIEAAGRILAQDVSAPHPLPGFRRATVDGYALAAQATFGASESLPAYLDLAGEIRMGTTPEFHLADGQCALIHTGGMLPERANSVVMLEYTQQVDNALVEVFRPVAVGENVIQVGEDVSQGELVLSPGKVLRSVEIGGLLALGLTEVTVFERPRIGILSSGDEIVAPEQQPAPGQVRDINAYSLSVLVDQAGGLPIRYGIVADQQQAFFDRAEKILPECDMLVITAGSSASSRDLTAGVINALGEPGVLVHGIQIRPGKPTVLGICAGKPVIGLPGNPVSALVAARLFILPVIQRLSGLVAPLPPASIRAALTSNLPSRSGIEEWAAVRLIEDPPTDSYLAQPIFGKSNLIFTLVRANGLICIPQTANGLEKGAMVEVFLL